MIAACPACATRYVVDPAALGPEGRKVRCARCKHVWQLTPPPETPVAEPAAPPSEPAPQTPRAARRPRPTPNLPALPRSDRRYWMIGWGALAAAFLIVILLLVVARTPVMAAFPGSRGLYRAVGLAATAPAPKGPPSIDEAISFTDLSLRLDQDAGTPVLIVSGTIRNGSGEGFDLPSLKATILDAARQPLYSWVFEAPTPHLAAHQTVPFSSRLSSPPLAVHQAVIEFAAQKSGTP
jgi:predicted Zn finger-like uncharacterized protein